MHAMIKYQSLQVAVISAVTIQRVADHTFFLWVGPSFDGPEIGVLVLNKDFVLELLQEKTA